MDIQPLCDAGIPCAGLTVSSGARQDKTDWYFYYHHTNADSITHLIREEVNKCVARYGVGAPHVCKPRLARDPLTRQSYVASFIHSMAVWSYAVADLPNLLPRA